MNRVISVLPPDLVAEDQDASLIVAVHYDNQLEIRIERSLDLRDGGTLLLEIRALAGRRFQCTGEGRNSAAFEIAPDLLEPLVLTFAKAVAIARRTGVLTPPESGEAAR
jgi:hypothetical protein